MSNSVIPVPSYNDQGSLYENKFKKSKKDNRSRLIRDEDSLSNIK